MKLSARLSAKGRARAHSLHRCHSIHGFSSNLCCGTCLAMGCAHPYWPPARRHRSEALSRSPSAPEASTLVWFCGQHALLSLPLAAAALAPWHTCRSVLGEPRAPSRCKIPHMALHPTHGSNPIQYEARPTARPLILSESVLNCICSPASAVCHKPQCLLEDLALCQAGVVGPAGTGGWMLTAHPHLELW